MNKLVRVFFNVCMSWGHDKLTELCKENGIKTRDMEAGQCVVFINGRRDRIKVYGAHQVIAYLRLEKGERFDLRMIQYIPDAFCGKKVDLNKALQQSVRATIERIKKEQLNSILNV